MIEPVIEEYLVESGDTVFARICDLRSSELHNEITRIVSEHRQISEFMQIMLMGNPFNGDMARDAWDEEFANAINKHNEINSWSSEFLPKLVREVKRRLLLTAPDHIKALPDKEQLYFVWMTRDGDLLLICDMSDDHLNNAIRMLHTASLNSELNGFGCLIHAMKMYDVLESEQIRRHQARNNK